MGYINGRKIFFAVQKKVYPANFQEKTITPNTFQKEITPDVGYDALSKVKLHGILIDPHSDIESQADNSVKYQKVIPNNVLTYGGLSKLGGKTYKSINIWDEEWESGSIDQHTGLPVENSNSIRSKNFIKVIPANTYYVRSGIMGCRIIFYDENQNYVGTNVVNNNNITISNATFYIKFYVGNVTNPVTTYNHDICINVSDVSINGNYYPYFEGLKYAYTKKVEITGFNILDEEFEVGGISGADGQNAPDNSTIRTKNYIRIIPNDTYYCKSPNYCNARWYDENMDYLGYSVISENEEFTIPFDNACYLRFVMPVEYGTTYNNDICINVSNQSLNGTYQPSYSNTLLEAKIVAIKQKLVGLGYSADVLGYGLPNVYNYIDLENNKVVLNMGGGDLGTLNWNKSSGFIYANLGAKGDNANIPNVITDYIDVNIITFNTLTAYPYPNGIAINNAGNIYIRNRTYNDLDDLISSLNGKTIVYELITPIEIDVSDILDNDDVIGLLESSGTITFENDEKYNLPSNVTYLVEVE